MKVIKGNCIEVLKTLEENSVDSVVTDPPYEIGFMGKSWDSSGIANNPEMWKECLRVLKPGGYLLSFSATRTYHRMAVGIEDAGFEIRDMIEWVYGSGFPKSHNIGKAVDKLQGNEREVTGTEKIDIGMQSGSMHSGRSVNVVERKTTKGTSEYEGWGTALKPAHEPICMARKPLAEKTVAENCLKWGTGGINIDESRVGFVSEKDKKGSLVGFKSGEIQDTNVNFLASPLIKANNVDEITQGRFPANLILEDCEEVRECFPDTAKGSDKPRNRNTIGSFGMPNDTTPEYADSGNASRFFKSIIYQAKPSKKERNAGCEGLEEVDVRTMNDFGDQSKHECSDGVKRTKGTGISKAKNNHPTVKPIALMEYLIKMVTPKGGVVLDPFMGSGTTGCASIKNGFDFIGIDLEEEYIKIATARIKHYKIF